MVSDVDPSDRALIDVLMDSVAAISATVANQGRDLGDLEADQIHDDERLLTLEEGMSIDADHLSNAIGHISEHDRRLDGLTSRLDGLEVVKEAMTKRLNTSEFRDNGISTRLDSYASRLAKLETNVAEIVKGAPEVVGKLREIDTIRGKQIADLENAIKLLNGRIQP